MAINPNEINIKNIVELIQSSSIKDNDLLVIGQGIYARKSTVLELYNKFGVPSILTSLNSLQFQINQLNNTVGNSVLYSPQVKTPQQKADARNNLDVYSRSETQTVVNSAIVNLGNVVNSVTNVNPALVDNSDPKNPVIAEFREISDYNNDMLNKADIDGNLTTGGIWWQDQVLSDRFSNYKQVWTTLINNTIEWGNIELDKHIFLVDDINGLKVKVGGTEGTIWNTLNLTNVSQLNNDAGYLQANDLDGFIYDVQYNSSAHTITFYQQNEPNIVVDLPIEQLIKGVQLVGNDLVFTFEDGSTVTVPLNTLLVGVVKSVNGLTPNSQGEIVLQITDIPNLSSELANKLDIRMAGLVSNLTQPEKDAILSKLGVVNNIVQVLGLSGNTITLSNGGGSISLNIANIGGLQTALYGKANVNGNNLTNISNWQSVLGISNFGDFRDYGLGVNGSVLWDLTNSDKGGFYNYNDDINLLPNIPFKYGNVISSGDNFQLLAPNYSADFYIRHINYSTGVRSIYSIFHSGNFDPNTKANVNGNNLTNIADWRNNLGVYSTTQVDGFLAGKADLDGSNSTGSLLDSINKRHDAVTLGTPNGLSLSGQFISLGLASASTNGALSSTDWNNFNNKLDASALNGYATEVWANNRFSLLGHTHNTSEITALTGYVLGTNTALSATDSLNTALGKIQAQINAKTSNLGTVTSITAGTGLSGGTITTIGTIALNSATLASLALANTALQVETDPIFTASPAYGITAGNISDWNAKQSALTNGLHTLLNGNKVDVAFDVNTYVKDKSNNDRLLFGNTASTDVVIKGAVAYGDFKIKDSTDADLFIINGSNKVPYFPQLPAPQTGDAYLAMFDAGNGLWKHSTRISDLVTLSALTPLLNGKANVNGNNTTGGTWNIDKINAPNLATANKQIFSEGGASVYFGNPQLEVVNFESLYDLIHIRNGVFGNVWTQHNFNPANYALLSQVYTQSQALALFVGLNGVQTIADTKTFTSSPVVPNGTLADHAINKSQLDAVSASIPNPANNGLLTISTSADLTGGGTFTADQATASNVAIGLSVGTLASLALADSALQSGDNVSELVNDAGYITASSLPTVNNGALTLTTGAGLSGSANFTANQSGNSNFDVEIASTHKLPTVAEWNALPTTNTTYTSSNGILLTGTNFEPTYGTTANTIAEGNDARFHNAVTLGTPNGLSLSGQVLSLGLAGASTNGALSSTDWNNFNNKVSANNGTFTVQGTGALTGIGSTSANASSNTSATLDLTTATKDDIALGKYANAQIQSLFSSVDRYYKLFDMSGGGAVDPSEQVITQIFTRSGNPTINISDHFLDGADLKIYGAAGGITTININAVNLVDSTLTTFNLEGNGRSFHWSNDAGSWVEYFN